MITFRTILLVGGLTIGVRTMGRSARSALGPIRTFGLSAGGSGRSTRVGSTCSGLDGFTISCASAAFRQQRDQTGSQRRPDDFRHLHDSSYL
jgi:hypothetical protein